MYTKADQQFVENRKNKGRIKLREEIVWTQKRWQDNSARAPIPGAGANPKSFPICNAYSKVFYRPLEQMANN